MFTTPSLNQYTFYFPLGGIIKYKIYNIGTPKIAGENFVGGYLMDKPNYSDCNNKIVYFYDFGKYKGVVEEIKE